MASCATQNWPMSITPLPPADDPPKPVWVDRCAHRLGERHPELSPTHAVESAEDLWSSARGDLSPEEAADMATGHLEPLEHLDHCFDCDEG